MKTVNVLGVRIALVCLEDVLEKIQQTIRAGERALITHTNVTGLCIACEQAWYRNFLNHSDLVFCDGMGVSLGARILGYEIPQRFTLADWIHPLILLGLENGYSFFFLGNPPEIAERAAGCLHARYPSLEISGTQHGFFDKTPGHPENEAVIKRILAAKPDILLTGMGMPLQEEWLAENWDKIDVPVGITCGALFEYLSGDLRRGPKWMTEHYLEWLARIFISPRRYLKRYIRDNSFFLYRIMTQKILGKYPHEEPDLLQ
jgi:N-acetylglucosaminyldiphosphoundecaprenol N-acetyl-beta-D-mannosaminyltransferase